MFPQCFLAKKEQVWPHFGLYTSDWPDYPPAPSRGHTLGLLSNSAWVYAFSHYPAEGQIVYCSPINHKPRIHMRKTTSWLCKDPHILTDGVLKVQPK